MAFEFKTGLTEKELIIKNVADMLEINKGTVPYDRDMGVDAVWNHKVPGRYTAAMFSEAADMVNSRETRARASLSATDSGFKVRVEINGSNG